VALGITTRSSEIPQGVSTIQDTASGSPQSAAVKRLSSHAGRLEGRMGRVTGRGVAGPLRSITARATAGSAAAATHQCTAILDFEGAGRGRLDR